MKCTKCGLKQRSQQRCKRCGNPFDSRTPAAPLAQDNPYAPPDAAHRGPAIAGVAGDIFRDGELLVARNGAPFPDRCVRCNQAAEGFRLRKTFYWHSPNWYALVIFNLLIYAIVAMVVRKKASFEVALCARHRSRRQWCIGFGLPILAFMLMMASAENVVDPGGFLLALLVGAIVGVAGARVLTPKKIDEEYAYFKGAHPQFLAGLPALR